MKEKGFLLLNSFDYTQMHSTETQIERERKINLNCLEI